MDRDALVMALVALSAQSVALYFVLRMFLVKS